MWILGCFRKPAGVNSTMCKLHEDREPAALQKVYTGGIYNMLCECGCPVGLEVYKGGESYINMLAFARKTLEVSFMLVVVIIYYTI